MGPWIVRDAARPFLPGVSLEVFRKRIVAGAFDRMVVRGPSTSQFWALASRTPGIANLAGSCHQCGTKVHPADRCCPACQAAFELSGEANELGLGAGSPTEAMLAHRKQHAPICPCCGDVTDADECAGCGTVFAPPDKTTRITWGPWCLRDPKRPFQAGISFDELRYRITTGGVVASTILRGPSTYQFWSIARNVPGISHLVGHCHACEGKADASQNRCPSCRAPFAVSFPPDLFGLMFPTSVDLAEARQRLREAQAILKQEKAGKESADNVPGVYLAALDQRFVSIAVQEEPRLAPYPSPSVEAQEPLPEIAQALSEPRRRRVTPPPHRGIRLSTAMAWLLPLVVIGAVVGWFWQSTQPPETTHQPEIEQVTGPAAELEQRWKQLAARGDRLERIESTPRFKPLIRIAKAQYTKISELWEDGRHKQAATHFEALDDGLAKVGDLEKIRRAAIAASDLSRSAAAAARQVGAEDDQPDLWQDAQVADTQGRAFLDKEQYKAAIASFEGAATLFDGAHRKIASAAAAREARMAVDGDLTRSFSRDQFNTDGGNAWQQALKLIAEGEEAYKTDQFDEAMEKFRQARALIPMAEHSIKQVVGINYWAFNTGYVVVDILFERVAGNPFDSSQRHLLRQSFENLRFEKQFMDTIPSDDQVAYDDLAAILITKVRDLLAGGPGEGARASFNIGIQFRILERLLKGDGGILSVADHGEIQRTLKTIEKESAAAAYSPQLKLFLDDFQQKLKIDPPYKAVEQCRQSLGDMLLQLSTYETAMQIVKANVEGT